MGFSVPIKMTVIHHDNVFNNDSNNDTDDSNDIDDKESNITLTGFLITDSKIQEFLK